MNVSDAKQGLSEKSEYGVTVENVSVKLLVNKSYNATAKDFVNIPHSHFYTELFVCLEDSINIQTKSGIIKLHKNDVAIIPATMLHCKVEDSATEKWYSVGFSITKKSGHACSDCYKKLNPLCENTEVVVWNNRPDICQRIEQIVKNSPKNDGTSLALELVCALLKLSTSNVRIALSKGESQTNMPDIYRLSWLEDVISNRFNEPLTNGQMAEALNISPRQFSRIVKARYGMTFHEVLIQTRLENAAVLLSVTERSVAQILKEVGYTKSSSFYRDFKARFNVNPTEYRISSAKK